MSSATGGLDTQSGLRRTHRAGEITAERVGESVVLGGWVQYFRVGNASHSCSEIRDYVEMKVRILLTRRKRQHKRSVGWRRWSNEYLYRVLGLFWDWKLRPLPGAGAYP